MQKQCGIYQTVSTKVLPPTGKRGTRIKAITSGGNHSITRPYPDRDTHEAHATVANELIDNLDWRTDRDVWYQGATKDGYVFVNVVLA